MDYEFSEADYELKMYVYYLSDVCALTEYIYDLRAELVSLNNYGVSSPRIKSIEESKYRDSPKVYMNDAPLRMIARKDALESKLKNNEAALKHKQGFCNVMMNKIACLSDDELELVGYRYFDGMTLRQIAELYEVGKNTIQRNLEKILARF